MSWAALIELVLKLVASVASYLGDKQLLDAGKAEAISAGLQATLDNMGKADVAKNELADNPDGDYARSVQQKYERADNE